LSAFFRKRLKATWYDALFPFSVACPVISCFFSIGVIAAALWDTG
jgi:hypothetical protein